MDLAELKDLIKSLLVAADGGCSIQQLLIDFEQETGFQLPYFNFYNQRDFLLTLTDIIKVFNTTSGEWVILVNPAKPLDCAAYVERQNRTEIGKNERPDFSTRNTLVENEAQRYDINLFIRAYQMGWVTLNEFGNWEKVGSRCGLVQDESDAEDIEFLFTRQEKDGLEDISARRATVRRFLGKIDFVTDPYSVDVRQINYPIPYQSASEEIQNALKHFMLLQNEAIWCRQLPALYYKFYGSSFNYKDYGYRSLEEMVKSLKDIFRCMKLQKDDWLLFDASKAPESDEEEMYIRAFRKFPKDIQTSMIQVLENYCEVTSEPGIPRDDFLALYYKKYRTKLDVAKYGFPDFKTMLSKLNGKILTIADFGGRVIIKPLIDRSKLGKRTLSSITPDDDDVFNELFPIDCIGFGTKFRELKPQCCFKLGRKARINVADVRSPHKFYIQSKKFEKDLVELMANMHLFYKFQENKYRMPVPTIRPNQICAAMYNSAGWIEWYRSIIIGVPDERHVVVFLVDFGMKLKLDNENIRFLHRDFYTLPKQAFLARMQNIKPAVDGKWPLSTVAYFVKLLSDPDVTFRTMRYDEKDDRLLGEILIPENNQLISVGTKLVRESRASKRLDDQEPFFSSDEETYGPCSQLVPTESCIAGVTQGVTRSQRNRGGATNSAMQNGDMNLPDEIYVNRDPSRSGFWETVWPELDDTMDDRARNEARERRLRSEWTWEKEVFASAFSLLNTADWLQDLTQHDIENGLYVARTLAEKIVSLE